jgi:hypothetical protein
MCKEMPVIPVDRVVDKKRIMGKMEGQGGEAQGVAAPHDTPPPQKKIIIITQTIKKSCSLKGQRNVSMNVGRWRCSTSKRDLSSS